MAFPTMPPKVNPSTVFNAVEKFFGSKPPAYTGPFTRDKFKGMSTDRVRWDPEANAWRFTDPAIGEDFTFTQDRAGNLLLSDGRVIPYGFGSTGSRDRQFPGGDIKWNIYNEEKKLEAGGGADSEFSQYWRGDPRHDPSKKTLRNWQDYVLSSGPFYNPVKPQQASPPQTQQQTALPPQSPQQPQQQTAPVVPPLETPPPVPQLPAPPTLPTATVAPPPQTPLPPQPPPQQPQVENPQNDPRIFNGGLLGNVDRSHYR